MRFFLRFECPEIYLIVVHTGAGHPLASRNMEVATFLVRIVFLFLTSAIIRCITDKEIVDVQIEVIAIFRNHIFAARNFTLFDSPQEAMCSHVAMWTIHANMVALRIHLQFFTFVVKLAIKECVELDIHTKAFSAVEITSATL